MPETATKTASRPSPDTPKAPPGRGNKVNLVALSRPPARKMRTDKADAFFTWWNNTHKQHPNRMICYGYRFFPVIQKPEGSPKYDFVYSEPPANVDAFYADKGCGDYRFFVNDSELSKNVCEIVIEGKRDFDNYPPDISVEELVWEDPANKDYIRKMRLKGIFPSNEERDMEQQQSGMAAAMANLSQTVTQLATEQMKQRPQREASIDGRLSAGIVDSIMQTRKMERDMLKETLDETRKMSTSSGDPVSQFKEMMGVVTPLLQHKSDSPVDLAALLGLIQQQNAAHLTQVTELNNARIAAMEKSNEMVLGIIRDQKNPPAESDLDKFLAYKEKFDKLGLATGDGGDDKITRYLAIGSALLPSAAQLLQGLVTASYNLVIASRNPSATPIPPPSQEEMQKQTERIQRLQSGQQANPQQQAYLQFLESIKGALIKHISSADLNGEDFAGWLIDSQQNGLMIYRALREQENAKEELVKLLSLHQEIWQQIAGAPQTLDRFLDEFLGYEENPEPEMPEGVTTVEKGVS